MLGDSCLTRWLLTCGVLNVHCTDCYLFLDIHTQPFNIAESCAALQLKWHVITVNNTIVLNKINKISYRIQVSIYLSLQKWKSCLCQITEVNFTSELSFQPRLIDSSSSEGFKPDKLRGEVEFKNIHFSYPSRPDTQVRFFLLSIATTPYTNKLFIQ